MIDFNFDTVLTALKAEAKQLGCAKSFVDDVQHLIDRLPTLYKAREKAK